MAVTSGTVQVVMPAMGDSVAEGTVLEWRKQEGDEGAVDEPIVEIQRVDHDRRVHLDIETDDIPAEVARLEELGATVVSRPRA